MFTINNLRAVSGGAPDGDGHHDLVQVCLEAAGDLQEGAALPVPARTHHAELLAHTLTDNQGVRVIFLTAWTMQC